MNVRELIARFWSGIVEVGETVGEAVAELDAPDYNLALEAQPEPTAKDIELLSRLPIEEVKGSYTLSIFPSVSTTLFYIAKDFDIVGSFVESSFILEGELDGHKLHVETNPLTQHVEVQADGYHAGIVRMKELANVAEFHIDGAPGEEQVYMGKSKKWAIKANLDHIVHGDAVVGKRIKWPLKFGQFHTYRVNEALSKYTVVALWAAFRPNKGV